MSRPIWQAAVFAAVGTGLVALAGVWAAQGRMLLLAIASALAVVAAVFALFRLAGWLGDRARQATWRAEEGRFHAFDGQPLHVEDDGRAVWIDGADLQQVLRTHDRDDVLAARHAGQWRRDGAGRLWLRADAVVARLASMPGRDAPRTIRLRRYLEREVLFPAERRRRAGAPAR